LTAFGFYGGDIVEAICPICKESNYILWREQRPLLCCLHMEGWDGVLEIFFKDPLTDLDDEE